MDRQYKVLVLEDNNLTRNLISNSLYQANYYVFESSNIKEAKCIFEKYSIDIVCLDLVLNRENGLEFLQYAKRKNSTTKFIAITNLRSRSSRIKVFDNGIDDYLPKPFIIEELLFRVNKILNQKSCTENLEFGSYILCVPSKILRYHEFQFSLTTSEYYIIEYLIKNNGIATIRGLCEYCSFKKQRNITIPSIIVTIKRLRDKFKLSSGNPFIRTRYAIGYYLA